jgi:hypothetical protein
MKRENKKLARMEIMDGHSSGLQQQAGSSEAAAAAVAAGAAEVSRVGRIAKHLCRKRYPCQIQGWPVSFASCQAGGDRWGPSGLNHSADLDCFRQQNRAASLSRTGLHHSANLDCINQ